MFEPYVTQVITTAVAVITTGAITAIAGIIRKLGKRQEAADEGVRALLRAEIIRDYYHYAERGWITLHGLEAVQQAYDAYHALGGNGTATKLMEDMQDLPVRDD